MKRLRSKVNNKYLIRGEWYQVVNETPLLNDGNDHLRKPMVELENHTSRIWHSRWFLKSHFSTIEELRNELINMILF